ncbi:DNA polymerase [Streptomyces sp. NPDC007063]|uniref:DNA polymerase n=1 Tax=Streptomyces sp. NPDC007063 TaxID=3364772 RepID=UPI00368474CE
MLSFTFPVAGEPLPVLMPQHSEDLEAFRRWVAAKARARERIAVDTEGKGLRVANGEPGYVRVVQFGNANGAWNVPIEYGAPFLAATRWALDTLPLLVGHNWPSFDAIALHKTTGLAYEDLCSKTIDTWLLANLVDPRKPEEGGIGTGLKALSARYVDPHAPDTQEGLHAVFRKLKVGHTIKNQTGWAAVPVEHPTYQSYAGGDVILTSRLLPKLMARLSALNIPQMLQDYEHELAYICGAMTIPGLLLDRPYTERLSAHLGDEAAKWSAVCARYGVEKIGSPKQIAEVLTDPTGFNEHIPERTNNGAIQVNKKVLHRLADLNPDTGEPRNSGRTPNPLAAALIKAKRAAKWKAGYADHFLEDADASDRVHPNIRTLEARTGRMSVTNPAAQTLPAGDWMIRRCLMAEEEHRIISVDFDSVELNVLAALADVRNMKGAIARGESLHDTTARLVFGDGFTKPQRKVAKAGNFLKVYGGGIDKLEEQTGAPREILETFFSQFNRAYPEVKRYGETLINEAYALKADRGGNLAVRTATGRVLPLDRDRMYAGTNYAVQSTARDCLGRALVNMREAGLLPYLRLAVHDEVIASAPEREAKDVGREIAKHMNFDLFGVPITASPEVGGRTWGSLYMTDSHGRLIPELAVEQDSFYASNPQVAYAAA